VELGLLLAIHVINSVICSRGRWTLAYHSFLCQSVHNSTVSLSVSKRSLLLLTTKESGDTGKNIIYAKSKNDHKYIFILLKLCPDPPFLHICIAT